MLRLTIRFMNLVAYCVHILLEYCFRLSIRGNILTSRENSKEFFSIIICMPRKVFCLSNPLNWECWEILSDKTQLKISIVAVITTNVFICSLST